MREKTLIGMILSAGLITGLASSAPPPGAGSSSAGVATLTAEPVPIPGGEAGIGFDDLGWAAGVGRVLVPAGRTGNLDLIDPATKKVESIGGFSAQEKFERGHGEGTTSADEGRGVLFAIDRTSGKLQVVDPKSKRIVGGALLLASPDYVRFVEPTNEVWVTEPDADQIEIFSLPASGALKPAHSGVIKVPGGPEALVIDTARGRAYSHLWEGSTVCFDIKGRTILSTWKNGCTGSRGIALDRKRNLLFAGCSEGKAVVLDLNKSGAIADSLSDGSGVDVIAYDSSTGHLYLPGAKSATMAILGVSASGKLSRLGTVKTAEGAHCVAVDDRRQAWVCDPQHGRLLLVRDELPRASK